MKNPLAFDRSMRRVDADGHLHIERANISKSTVNPYYGREIPGGAELGLNPDRVYMLYRHPGELERAAGSFAGKPLLLHHVPVSAGEPATDLVVGTIGTDVRYEHPFLTAPLSIWRQDAIDAVESGEQRELSCGYRYTPSLTPGVTAEGLPYDIVMSNLIGNHVALVSEGRAGPDVIVADEMPTGISDMRFKTFFTALAAALPSLKAEQVVALDAALDAEMKALPAKDAFPDMSAEDKKTALDKFCAKTGKAMDALTDEDKDAAYRGAKDGNPVPGSGAEKPALDAALVKTTVDAAVTAALVGTVIKADADKLALDAVTAARAEVHALYAARIAVEPTVGVVALDSADAVYRFALDHLKVEHKDIPVTALAALYTASAKASTSPAIAADAAFDVSSIWTPRV